MDKCIAILEDCSERIERMKQCIKKTDVSFETVFFSDAYLMIEWLIQNKSDVILVSLDHDLDLIMKNGERHDPGTGKDVTNHLFSQEPFCSVIIHSSNYFGRESMKYQLLDKGWDVSIVMPSPEVSWIDSDWLPCVCSLVKNRKI